MKTNEYEKTIDALNTIDEMLEHCDMTHEEQMKCSKAYHLVADFINKNAKR